MANTDNMKLIGPDDDVYEIVGFIELCKDQTFIDDDGFGYYATSTHMDCREKVKPSDIVAGKINRKFDHVVWFNK